MSKNFTRIGNSLERAVKKLTGGSAPAVYYGYVKIHGTNSGIGKLNGEIFYQSRNRELTPEDDNYGFAKAMSKIDWATKIPEGYIIFGEWAGKGVQKKVGVSQLPKTFYPFIAYRIDTETYAQLNSAVAIYYNCEGVDSIALTTPYIKISIDSMNLSEAVEEIKKATLEVETVCPVAKANGIVGVGEGLVFRPCVHTHGSKAYDPETWFKSKGDKYCDHGRKIPKSKPKDHVSEAFLTPLIEARGVQGLQYLKEMGHELDMISTRVFIEWMVNDIKSEVEIPKEVNQKCIGSLAALWFKANHEYDLGG